MEEAGAPSAEDRKRASRSGIGRAGEDAIVALLESEGWRILARNFRGGPGELDIVAFLDPVLAFVEVKHWRSFGSVDLGRSIDGAKRRRIVETSKIFLSLYREYSMAIVRYDVILVRGNAAVERYESAFTGEV